MKFFINEIFSKCDQISNILWTWLHLLKKSLMENLIFCAVIWAEAELYIITKPKHKNSEL